MAFSRNTLSAFLKYAKGNLHHAIEHQRPVTLVIGNQSADLDSLTSSVIYAYLRSQSPPANAFTPLYVPILNIPAADISLRPEFQIVFKHANIEPSQLSTLDDVGPCEQWKYRLPPDRTRLVLVDHNKLEGELGTVYGTRVQGVIDHHQEEHAIPADTAPEPRVVEKCGSCTSLVVRELTSTWDGLDSKTVDGVPTTGCDADVAKLALASILIDTRNLTEESKVRDVDKESTAYLETKIRNAEDGWSRSTFYHEIDEAKKDIESLPLNGILRKDYKEWREENITLGISSVVKPLSLLLSKAAQEQGYEPHAWDCVTLDFMKHRKLDLWAVMTAYADGNSNFRRELLVRWAEGRDQTIVERFVREFGSELQLEETELKTLGTTDAMERVRIWRQGNTARSRKQVGPALRKSIKTVACGAGG